MAALLHLNLQIPLGVIEITGQWFPRAAIPEALIALVLTIGAATVFAIPKRAWVVAVGAHAFAVVGVLVGLFTIAIGVGPRTVPDVAYHMAVLAVLLAGLVVLSTPSARAALGHRRPSLAEGPPRSR